MNLKEALIYIENANVDEDDWYIKLDEIDDVYLRGYISGKLEHLTNCVDGENLRDEIIWLLKDIIRQNSDVK